jgi:transaldolase
MVQNEHEQLIAEAEDVERSVTENKVKQLVKEGQSIWQDDISRQMIQNGELQRSIEEIGIRGVTSNPTIFQKAIAAGDVYDEEITNLLKQGMQPAEVFQTVAVKDIQDACDIFRLLYDETGGEDGYVSIEVLPSLARDAEGTLENARVLWSAIDRPNLMVKVPGTDEGVSAIRTLLTEGININVTLLFSLANYERVARAYIEALAKRHENGLHIESLASVASFFVSRVDTLADKLLDEKLASGNGDSELIRSLKGKVAVANAVMAYEKFQELFGSDEFKPLADAGAMVQRPLWASTGTKNPEYSDVLYVDSLIGPHTVNTAPPKTIAAFLDHGTVKRTVDSDYAAAHKVLDDLHKVGLDIDEITKQLEEEGIETFMSSYDELLAGVEGKRSLIEA